MSIKKQYLKTRPVCKVTFRIPKSVADEAATAKVVGDFNNWNQGNGFPMKSLKNGAFSVTVELEKGKEYQFRYLLDGKRWENDEEADREVPTPFPGESNSVIVL